MHIFITGGSGFIGRALVNQLLDKHQVTVLTRTPDKTRHLFKENDKLSFVSTLACYANFDQFDAIINLAGEPIIDQAWSEERKQVLIDSRVTLTEQLVQLINNSVRIPHTFISGSATGYYGDCADKTLDENSPASDQFAGKLCVSWENTALQANTRVCLLRTGIVLSARGGALEKMLAIYRYGLGGRLGSGEQYWPWISLTDMVNAIIFLLEHPTCQGAFNIVASIPEKNKVFNCGVARAIKRPAFLRIPTFVLRYLLGERASILLDSQRVLPIKLQQAGFTFTNNDLKTTLNQLLNVKNS